MRSLTRGTATLTLALLATLTACTEDATPAGAPSDDGASAATTDAADAGSDASEEEMVESSPIDGTWLIERTRAQMRASLERHDLGEWAQQFFTSEEVGKKATWLFTFEGGRFDGKWANSDGTWKSGWYGPMEVTDDRVHLVDEEFGTTDIYRWSIRGDELVMRYVRSQGAPEVRGIPEEVYVRAYFGAPLKRTDCPPEVAPCRA